MFDVGFSELVLIAVVALLVLGPERLPGAARTVGALLRKARHSFESVKAEVEREVRPQRHHHHEVEDVDELDRPHEEQERPLRDCRHGGFLARRAPRRPVERSRRGPGSAD